MKDAQPIVMVTSVPRRKRIDFVSCFWYFQTIKPSIHTSKKRDFLVTSSPMSLMFTIQTDIGEIKPTETETFQFGRAYQSTITAHFVFRRNQKPNARFKNGNEWIFVWSLCTNRKLLSENLMEG